VSFIAVIEFLFSIADFLAGITILGNSFVAGWLGADFVMYVAIIILAKGLYSLLTSLASGYFFDWMGYCDVSAGLVIFLAGAGVSYEFFALVGIVMLVKSFYTWARIFLQF
jgi:hypothetical protein